MSFWLYSCKKNLRVQKSLLIVDNILSFTLPGFEVNIGQILCNYIK